MRCTRIFYGLILIFAFVGCSKPKQSEAPTTGAPVAGGAATQSGALGASGGANTAAPATDDSAAVVRLSMQNVDYHLTDSIIVDINFLNGRLTPKPGKIPVFDDKNSFGLAVDSANMTMSMTALTNDLNDYVFAKPDAPLKHLSATTEGNQLVIRGLLVSKGGIPFQTSGTLAVTPEGMIRVHTTKVKALKLPVKGLMDLLGLDTQKLLNTNKVEGVSVEKDDLILDPEKILPPPQLQGRLTSLKIENGKMHLTFGPENRKTAMATIAESCGARNYLHFKGGAVRFGKLTMNDTDLELLDVTPADPFDFSIDHYNEQLVAGYSKTTQTGGLCVHTPDYNKLKKTATAEK
jgi:hypothetical protein